MDPIIEFIQKYPINTNEIQKLVCGEKYVSIELLNGNIGVCATLNIPIDLQITDLNHLDLQNETHRIVINAYINAKTNYVTEFKDQQDIFDQLDFSNYKKIVMVGYFKSLVDKFINAGIKLTIFDKVQKDNMLDDMAKQAQTISEADALILTSTTVFNKTFHNIIDLTNNECDIFMLGPSTILDRDMFSYKNIKMIFGAIFNKSDPQIHEIIQKRGGTKSFLPYMKKVYLTK